VHAEVSIRSTMLAPWLLGEPSRRINELLTIALRHCRIFRPTHSAIILEQPSTCPRIVRPGLRSASNC
jgi:hypothetical protein